MVQGRMAQNKIKLRIILPGGGVKGCFQIGVLEQILASNQYEVDSVYGCSVGSILAPFVANGINSLIKAKGLFTSITSISQIVEPHKLFNIIPFPDTTIVKGLSAFLQMGAYKSFKIVDQAFSLLTGDELYMAANKCHVVAYDICNNKEAWFSGPKLKDGIRASSALWLAVPPVSVNNVLYSDGGVTEVFPMDYILEHDLATDYQGIYLFVDCDSRQPYTVPAPTDGLSLMSNLQWASASRLADFELARLKDKLQSTLVIVRPDVNVLQSALDINPERMQQTYQAGVQLGKAFLVNTTPNLQ